MDSLAHRWHDRWQRLSLPSLTQRLRAGVAARRAALLAGPASSSEPGLLAALLAGQGGASFDAIAAATEEGAGMISAWEHAGAVAAADDTAWDAAAAGMAAQAPAEAAGALLSRLKLRLLRGGDAIAQAAPASASTSGLGMAAASPLDAVSALAAGSGAGGASLAALLQAAAAYPAERVQHMRRLLGAPSPAGSTAPAAHA